MNLSVAEMAKAIGTSTDSLLSSLDEIGIWVSNPEAPLKEEQIRKITSVIQQVKMEAPAPVEKLGSENMEEILVNHKIFIDTCSLYNKNIVSFINKASPILEKISEKIILPLRVLDEIKKHIAHPPNADVRASAPKALALIEEMQAKNLLEVRGEPSDNFADNVFHVVFTKHRLLHSLLLITQDNGLAQDILNLNKSKSTRGYPVSVKRIIKGGNLGDFSFSKSYQADRDEVASNCSKKTPAPSKHKKRVVIEDKFKRVGKVTLVNSAEKLEVDIIPVQGDSVYTENGEEIKLLSHIATGGEGSIYTTNTEFVCKVYKKEKIDKLRFEKIQLMVSKKLQCNGVCWPIDMIFNRKKEFVGFLMPKADGIELQKCFFIKPLLLRHFPKWKKRDAVELCLTILEKIVYLHKKNVILGDINPMNILVVDSKNVFFVDTDSYQTEGFPCPVGTINFTAPEIQRKNFASFLRTFENEYFAVATLLFMIMLPGKPPYSQQGGENPIDNIIKMDFSYPLGDSSNKKTPDGPWRFIWSHMTFDIKKAFYQTFRKGEELIEPSKRLSAQHWYGRMEYYLKCLDEGRMAKQDSMSEELFPTRFKKVEKLTYIRCKICKKEIAEENSRNGTCWDCIKVNNNKIHSTHICISCGSQFSLSQGEYDYFIQKSLDLPKRCSSCRGRNSFSAQNTAQTSKKDQIHSTLTCVSCGRRFSISQGEFAFFQQKGLSIPKRCPACRGISTPQHSRQSTKNKPKEGFFSSLFRALFG